MKISRSYTWSKTDVSKESKERYTQEHLDKVDRDTKKKLLESDHFMQDPIGGAYLYKALCCVLPGDVIPFCINKCLIQFMKGNHDLSCGNSCRSGFTFEGSPSVETMKVFDEAYGCGIQFGSNVKNVLCMNGRVGHCSISPRETKTCRCANLNKDECSTRVAQINFFESAFRAKGALGFYHSFAGKSSGVVRNIIEEIDAAPHQKCSDSYHLQHFSSSPVIGISSRRQLDTCTKVIEKVSNGYVNCCTVHETESGVARAADTPTLIEVASDSEKLLYVSRDPGSWTQSKAWLTKASKRMKGLWDRPEYRERQRKSWDKKSRVKQGRTRREHQSELQRDVMTKQWAKEGKLRKGLDTTSRTNPEMTTRKLFSEKQTKVRGNPELERRRSETILMKNLMLRHDKKQSTRIMQVVCTQCKKGENYFTPLQYKNITKKQQLKCTACCNKQCKVPHLNADKKLSSKNLEVIPGRHDVPIGEVFQDKAKAAELCQYLRRCPVSEGLGPADTKPTSKRPSTTAGSSSKRQRVSGAKKAAPKKESAPKKKAVSSLMML